MKKPKEVADEIKSKASTIRSWSNEFGEFLSNSARGGEGRHRSYDELDVLILNFIKVMVDEGYSRDDIFANLKVQQSRDWDNLPELPVTVTNMAEVPMVPSAASEAQITALRHEIELLNERIEDLQDRYDEALDEAERRLTAKDSEYRATLEQRSDEIKSLLTAKTAAETELELWRSGRLRPDKD